MEILTFVGGIAVGFLLAYLFPRRTKITLTREQVMDMLKKMDEMKG